MIDGSAPIREFMTSPAITVETKTAVSDARNLMARERIRHLPVTHNGALVGIVSARDVMVVEDLKVFASYDSTVESTMARYPVSVAPDTSVREVVKLMVAKDIGAVLVMKGDKLEGIFTDADAVRLLATELG